jgi:hypothetical protein
VYSNPHLYSIYPYSYSYSSLFIHIYFGWHFIRPEFGYIIITHLKNTIMKTKFVSGKKCLSISLFLGVLFFIAGCHKDNDDAVNNNPYTISGNANGAQVYPALADTGMGTGTITGTYNPVNRLLTYNSTWSNLSGAPINGGFYNGASGTSGTPIGAAWTFDSTATGTGSRSDTLTLTSDQASQLLGGDWYYSYGTSENSSGEIRGQMSATR